MWNEEYSVIRNLINPATFPVGVAFLEDPEKIPSGARRPLRDLGVRIAPCQAAAMARRYGWTVAMASEDVGCAIAAHTHSWKTADEAAGVEFLLRMNYAASPEAAREVLRGFRELGLGGDLAVLYAPLEKLAGPFDVLLIYCNPAQTMRLIHGATCLSGRPLTGTFSGRASSCTEGVVAAFLDQAPKVVVPGNGDRVWGGCQDHEMVFAIPFKALPGILEGLQKTHATGIRYPIPTYLRYAPEVAFSLPLADIFDRDRLEAWKR